MKYEFRHAVRNDTSWDETCYDTIELEGEFDFTKAAIKVAEREFRTEFNEDCSDTRIVVSVWYEGEAKIVEVVFRVSIETRLNPDLS